MTAPAAKSELSSEPELVEYKFRKDGAEVARAITFFYLGGSIVTALGSLAVAIALHVVGPPGWERVVGVVVGTLFFVIGTVAAIALVLTRPLFIAIAADGMWLRSPYEDRRFIAFADVHAVVERHQDVTIVLKNGTKVECHFPWRDYDRMRVPLKRLRDDLFALRSKS